MLQRSQRCVVGQVRYKRRCETRRVALPDDIASSWDHYGKPTYSRNSYEHMIGFDHWKKWTNYRSKIPPNQETAVAPIWAPFAATARADPDPSPADVAFGELPNPSTQALHDSAVDPKAILHDKPHLIQPSSPLASPDYFHLRRLISVSEMMKHRVHLGHKVGTLHDRMRPFLFGQRLETCIIDLDKTKEHLFRALNFMAHMAYRDGIILFASLNRDHQGTVEKGAMACKEFAHTRRWVAGTLTDSTGKFGTVVRLPDLVVLTSTRDALDEEHPAVAEAAKMSIPTLALVDSNSDPTFITYPIPANDDTDTSVKYFMELFSKTINAAKKRRKQDAKNHDEQQEKQYLASAEN